MGPLPGVCEAADRYGLTRLRVDDAAAARHLAVELVGIRSGGRRRRPGRARRDRWSWSRRCSTRGGWWPADANLRVREGAGGGASHKASIDVPQVREHLAVLGEGLGWHGALSLDAIVVAGRPHYIDVNPRLVEPGNAARSRVDLVGALISLARDGRTAVQPPGAPGVRTHQALLALLGAATRPSPRRAVAGELASVLRRSGTYRGSTEELTPLRGGPEVSSAGRRRRGRHDGPSTGLAVLRWQRHRQSRPQPRRLADAGGRRRGEHRDVRPSLRRRTRRQLAQISHTEMEGTRSRRAFSVAEERSPRGV